MFRSNPPDSNILKAVLEPLLDDFQYWFTRSQTLLEGDAIAFLTETQQTELLAKVITAQQEVAATQALMKVTDGQAGVETSVLMNWHQLVTECWQISLRLRSERFS
jgi:Protein of unknown function (DUF2605)